MSNTQVRSTATHTLDPPYSVPTSGKVSRSFIVQSPSVTHASANLIVGPRDYTHRLLFAGMLLRSALRFTRTRMRCALPPLPRVSVAARITLGVSACIYLASLNGVHGDADENEPSAPSENTEHEEVPLNTRIRIMSRGARTLISILEGDFVTRANVADVIEENLWFNLEALFRWYQIDHSTPQPVEFIHEPHPPPEAIHSVIKTAINFTDEYILNHFLGRVFSSLSKKNAPDAIRATSASCLVSALYEDDVRLLHVASLGNMRAVLGRPRAPAEDGAVMYDVHVLSVDHTPNNSAERSRVQGLHEGEELFEDDKLFGRAYTRALGDGKLKWSTDVQSRLHRDYLGAAPDPKVKTPPYLSAEPDVSTIKIEPGDFLVMASSWLPECLTDEEVVGLVGAWLNKNQETNLFLPLNEVAPDPTPGRVLDPEDLPVKLREDKTIMYRRWNVPKRFINTDPNPTGHLASNAMGGAESDLRQALLELAPHESEGNTKSLGIAVVFFQ
ncbi:phosphatase 2C-like domain-containing protein [Mycena pura]|uniref:Phosphatase 2C-like domain-containing protein n=1 Tax=Mycena pura TaxID=153505 RepID=A0AAD6YI38_9AGAR|nr:phosphatase 2C-like domain-containing protein [Mycena pura]